MKRLLCKAGLGFGVSLGLSACSFAPPFQPPPMPIPPHYKESVSWVLAKPSLESTKKNCLWWTVFEDDSLNDLENRLTQSNPSLQLAYARFQESRDLVQAARSQLYPTVLLNGGKSRQKNSDTVANSFNQSSFIYNTLTLQAYLSYEIDAWGQIRNTISASVHAARASEFDLATADLSLHAELATIYFQLRGDDASQVALDNIVKSYQHALDLYHHLHRDGAVSALEEDQAVSQLEHAKTAAINMRMERAMLQHALAVLTGEIPANFQYLPSKAPMYFVALSPGSPSTLLESRPDVAATLESVASANATIGVARAAFFPTFTLGSILGYQSKNLSSLLSKPSLIWALGPPSGLTLLPPEVSQVLFDGYFLQANLKRATARYYETVHYYQQVVLKAFQDVEDGLVETYRLDQENQKQVSSTRAAKKALYQANQRMIEGMDTYLGVVNIEVNELNMELDLIDIQTKRQVASVYLIKALGGGWDIKQAIRRKI